MMNDSIVEIDELAKIIVHNAKYNVQMHVSELSTYVSLVSGRVSAIEYDVVDHCVNVAELIAEINNAHAKN